MAGVFISYRSDDAAWAIVLDRELSARFGGNQVFLATRSIRPSENFIDRIFQTVRSSSVLLAVIGPAWLAADKNGQRRIDDDTDWVRREIAEALAAEIPIIPILTDDAIRPNAADLPDDIKRLGYCQALRLHHYNASYDLMRILDELTKLLPDLSIRQRAVNVSPPTPGAELDETASGALLTTLPPDRPDFTGRIVEIRSIVETLTASSTDHSPIVTIHGQPGVGKSALAIRVAYMVADTYPGGQLYIDLQGAHRQPLTVTDASARLLSALGVTAAKLPTNEKGRIALYQKLLTDTQRLVILDNARATAQVRSLVPQNPGCAALVTSRTPLGTLDSTAMLALDALDEQDAVTLLARILGNDPRLGDRTANATVVRLCECLPLAVHIAAAQLRSRSHWTVEHLANRLTDERQRLPVLEVDDLAVRTSFASSYDDLTPTLARAFSMLGNVEAPDFAPWILAALLDTSQVDAEDLVEHLTDAQLVSFVRRDSTGAHRYRCHDLLRLYASEKSVKIFSVSERSAAVKRMLSGYMRLALAGIKGLGPGIDVFLSDSVPLSWQPPDNTVSAVEAIPAIHWFTDERPSLVAAVRQAFAAKEWALTWGIAEALNILFVRQRHGDESLEVKQLALKAARAAGNSTAEAAVLFSFAGLRLNRGEYAEAVTVLREAMAIYQKLHMTPRYVRTMLTLGVVERDRGHLPQAAEYLTRCIKFFESEEDELILASARQNYAVVLREQCRLAESMEMLDYCLPVFLSRCDDVARGRALHTRAILYRYLGRLEDAEADLAVARRLLINAGDARWTAIIDLSMLRVLGQRGRWRQLLDGLSTCEKMFMDIDDNAGRGQVMRTRGAAFRAVGEVNRALAEFEQAWQLYQSIDDERTKAHLRYAIGLTYLRFGHLDAALVEFRRAEVLCANVDDKPWLLRSQRRLAWLAEIRSGMKEASPLWQRVAMLATLLQNLAGPEYRPFWLEQIVGDLKQRGQHA